jgi:hypothetical protein
MCCLANHPDHLRILSNHHPLHRGIHLHREDHLVLDHPDPEEHLFLFRLLKDKLGNCKLVISAILLFTPKMS